MKVYDKDIAGIVFTKEQIAKRVSELAKEIVADYEEGEEVVVVTILRGSMIFVSDLVREMDMPVYMDTMAVASYYNSSHTTGKVKINKDMEMDITGKNVLIVEDIIDTGTTLEFLKGMLNVRGAKTIKLCSFLSKPSRRETNVEMDYIGFEVEDKFVIGYGLDYAQKYRNYDCVAYLKEEVYKK